MCIVIITFDNQGNNVYCIIIKTNERKKFLFFLPSSCGGAERMTILIAKFLKEADFIAFFCYCR